MVGLVGGAVAYTSVSGDYSSGSALFRPVGRSVTTGAFLHYASWTLSFTVINLSAILTGT